jgi:hypothetical protein
LSVLWEHSSGLLMSGRLSMSSGMSFDKSSPVVDDIRRQASRYVEQGHPTPRLVPDWVPRPQSARSARGSSARGGGGRGSPRNQVSVKPLPADPWERAQMMSHARVQGVAAVLKREVAKASEVEGMAADLAALREHEATVAKKIMRRREAQVRQSFNLLISTGVNTTPRDDLNGDGAERIREAMRETARACIRVEEAKKRREVAAREAQLETRLQAETREKRAELRRKVRAKREQEEERLAHMREVEEQKQARAEVAEAERLANAAAKAESKKLWLAEKAEREKEQEAVSRANRAAKDARAERMAEEREREAEAKTQNALARAKAKEHAKEVARVQALVEYAKRQEKVWQAAARFLERCLAEYEKEVLIQQKKQTSFTEEILGRRKARVDQAREREKAAKAAFEISVLEVNAASEGPRSPRSPRKDRDSADKFV